MLTQEEINNKFPNGITSYLETHYEVVDFITTMILKNKIENTVIDEVQGHQGIGGLYELAEDLTDKFEKKYKGKVWGEELDFFDVIDEFLKEELK
jgi:hypothetical protein